MTVNTKIFVLKLAVKKRLEGSLVESCKDSDAVDNEGLIEQRVVIPIPLV